MARKARPKRTATAKRTSTRANRRKKKPEVEVAAIGTAEETPSGSWSLGGLLKVAVGSLLLLVGLWSRWAAFIMSGEIAVAYFMRRAPNGFFPQVSGGGLEVLFCFVFLFLFFAGPGPWSADAVRRVGRVPL